MLELMRERLTPAAILMGEVDAILALGVIVGRELGYPTVPVVEVDPEVLDFETERHDVAHERVAFHALLECLLLIVLAIVFAGQLLAHVLDEIEDPHCRLPSMLSQRFIRPPPDRSGLRVR